MGDMPHRVRSYEGYFCKMSKSREECRAKTVIGYKVTPRLPKNHSDGSRIIPTKMEKSSLRRISLDNENYKIIRAMLLTSSILVLCYYGLQNGPSEYSILENEQILPGFVSSRRSVLIFSLGYSIWYSLVSAVVAVMFVYSIISKRPQFSLPLIGHFLTELVYDSCKAVMIIFYFFAGFQPQTALFYTAGLLLLILAEIWMWLGVLRLYEHRSFKSC